MARRDDLDFLVRNGCSNRLIEREAVGIFEIGRAHV